MNNKAKIVFTRTEAGRADIKETKGWKEHEVINAFTYALVAKIVSMFKSRKAAIKLAEQVCDLLTEEINNYYDEQEQQI